MSLWRYLRNIGLNVGHETLLSGGGVGYFPHLDPEFSGRDFAINLTTYIRDSNPVIIHLIRDPRLSIPSWLKNTVAANLEPSLEDACGKFCRVYQAIQTLSPITTVRFEDLDLGQLPHLNKRRSYEMLTDSELTVDVLNIASLHGYL
jgi:hypothetical protein